MIKKRSSIAKEACLTWHASCLVISRRKGWVAIYSFKSAYKIWSGVGSLSILTSELQRLEMNNPLIVSDHVIKQAGLLQELTDLLKSKSYGLFLDVEPEPGFAVIEACKQVFVQGKHDGLIALGGGSVIDTAKATGVFASYSGALTDFIGTDLVPKRGVSLIAIPTTAGTGSEVTNVAVLSDPEAQLKKGIASDYLLPDVAIVAPEMTRTAPAGVTAASGVDALVHAIEAYLSNYASPVTDALALKAMRMIAVHLPIVYHNPNQMESREAMAAASLMAGMAFGNAGVGAVHALAYPLGGRFHVAHGVSNAVLLPFVMRRNQVACTARLAEVADALGEEVHGLPENEAADQAIIAMERLCTEVNIPVSLKELGVSESDLELMASDAVQIDRLLKNNPLKMNVDIILAIYKDAFKGR